MHLNNNNLKTIVMKSFKDLNIKPIISSFVGDKIPIKRIINCEIVVLDFKIGPSNQKEGTKCLTLQIEKNKEKRIVFTGSKVLMQMIEEAPKDAFPFTTTIINDNDFY